MDAKQMKLLTGKRNKYDAIAALCRRIELRDWSLNGNRFYYAGYDMRKGLVHFTRTVSLDGGGVSHRRIGVSMDDAIDCISGQIKPGEFQIIC